MIIMMIEVFIDNNQTLIKCDRPRIGGRLPESYRLLLSPYKTSIVVIDMTSGLSTSSLLE